MTTPVILDVWVIYVLFLLFLVPKELFFYLFVCSFICLFNVFHDPAFSVLSPLLLVSFMFLLTLFLSICFFWDKNSFLWERIKTFPCYLVC